MWSTDAQDPQTNKSTGELITEWKESSATSFPVNKWVEYPIVDDSLLKVRLLLFALLDYYSSGPAKNMAEDNPLARVAKESGDDSLIDFVSPTLYLGLLLKSMIVALASDIGSISLFVCPPFS
jgi:hypothetical protein